MKVYTDDLMYLRCKYNPKNMIHSLISWVWWKLQTGAVVTVPWPEGWGRWPNSKSAVMVHEQGAYSADPNDHYRPWLEEHIGKQGRDWEWEIARNCHDQIVLTLRRSKRQYASIIALMWG